MNKPLAQIGYEAYAGHTSNKTWNNQDMPDWAGVKVHGAWNASVMAILRAAIPGPVGAAHTGHSTAGRPAAAQYGSTRGRVTQCALRPDACGDGFGNAGFGMWPDGASRLSTFSLLVITPLVVLGGTGFVALDEIERYLRGRFQRHLRPPPPSTQTRVALKMMGALLLGGAVLFAALEWQRVGTLGPLLIPDKLFQATFQSIVRRSVGFATLDYGKFAEPTLLLIMTLMFVGGSPSSTAGGIKTTTAAVLLATTCAVSAIPIWRTAAFPPLP